MITDRPLNHEERQALIRKPFPITYIHPVKRWAGVQLGVYPDWFYKDSGMQAPRATVLGDGNPFDTDDDEENTEYIR